MNIQPMTNYVKDLSINLNGITTECIDGNEKKSDDAEPDFYSIPDDEPAQML